MELTLTGAYLNPEIVCKNKNKDSKIDRNNRVVKEENFPVSRVSVNTPKVSLTKSSTDFQRSTKFAYHCSYHYKSLPTHIPVLNNSMNTNLYDHKNITNCITQSVKYEKFESFEYFASLILTHEADHGPPPLAKEIGDSIGSVLVRRIEDGHTLAHWCAKRLDDIRFMEYLSLIPKINLHLPSIDNVGMYPIHWAATVGSIPIIAIILNHFHSGNQIVMTVQNIEFPINSRDKSGCTPLHIASQYGHANLAAFLIKRGADPNIFDNSHDTPLHWAAYKGSVSVCGLLLYLNGIENHLELQDAYGQSPIHLASLRGNVDVISYLFTAIEVNLGFKDKTKFLRKLLTLLDKNGKTPLDLAVKKNKTDCETLLRFYMDSYNRDTNSKFQTIYSSIRLMFNIQNWKLWLGLNTFDASNSSMSHSSKFICWFVTFNMILSLILEFFVYVPLPIWNSFKKRGRLWDYRCLHLLTILSHLTMWVTFILVHKTDPGIIAKQNKQSFRHRLFKHFFTDENTKIEVEMTNVTNNLRTKYEETLESFAKNVTLIPEQISLCHSCHIARPLRSKHCRIMNKCVLLFDHHCPFVGTTIGLYNYRYFLIFLLSSMLVEIFTAITALLHHFHSPYSVEIGFCLVATYLFLYTFLIGGLLIYHAQLVKKNLTTNEHQNLFKYTYLKDKFGRYHNPFDNGFMENMKDRLFPGSHTYELPVSLRYISTPQEHRTLLDFV